MSEVLVMKTQTLEFGHLVPHKKLGTAMHIDKAVLSKERWADVGRLVNPFSQV